MNKLRAMLMAAGASGAILGAAQFLAPSEGLALTPYNDLGGVKTWCYGQTVGTSKAQYTEQECAADLAKTVGKYWDGISDKVPPEAPQSVKEAMISVAYNVGVGGWKWSRRGVPSPFVGHLAARDWQGSCEAIIAPWTGRYGVAQGYKATVNGKPIRGLENRRWKEYRLCMRDVR